DHLAQRRAVGGTSLVVLDGVPDGLGPDVIAEAPEEREELLDGEQIEQHRHVGLLGDLELVGRAALGLEDPVEALDAAVALPVALPVELLELFVALELTDDAIVEGDRDPPADPLPLLELGLVDGEHLEELGAPAA